MDQEILGVPLTWLLTASVIAFVGTLLLVPIIVVRMPADYFLEKEPPEDSFRRRHPGLSFTLRMMKNAAGAALVVVGLVLLVLPGQGLLTILLGLVLIEFPGKRRLELAIVRRKPVHLSLDWTRRLFGRPELRLPDRQA